MRIVEWKQLKISVRYSVVWLINVLDIDFLRGGTASYDGFSNDKLEIDHIVQDLFTIPSRVFTILLQNKLQYSTLCGNVVRHLFASFFPGSNLLAQARVQPNNMASQGESERGHGRGVGGVIM